jgi:tetratricopeptide (TPR) repeat protein
MANVVVADRIDALLLAIERAPSPSDILAEIMAGVERVTGLSPEVRSHWLLDLSVLGRKLGFASDTATLAMLAYEIRKEALGLDDTLSISAVLEATDVLLEARRSEEAERLCSEVLAAVGPMRDPAVTRLRLNRCSALFNVGRGAEAEEQVRALLPELGTDEVGNAELIGAYNLLGACCLKRGSADEAQAFAVRAVEGSTRLMGRRTRETAVFMLNLAMIQLRHSQPDAAVATLAEVLSIYSELLDPGHPWVENAEHAYFGALSEAGRIAEAVAFVVSRLERFRDFERAAPWMFVAATTLAAAASQCAGEGVRTIYLHIDDLVTSSSEEAWTGELTGRFVRRVGASLGIEDDDGKGLIIAALYVWVLVVVASVQATVVGEGEARQHFATLETRVGQLMGVPAPALLDGRVEQAWRFFTHRDWPGEAALLHKLAPASRDAGLIDAFKALAGRASSVAALRAEAEAARAESGGDSDVAGQALILVAARAAAAGDFDTAIPAQTEAVAIAGRLFGPDSMQRSTAVLNLGALQFRAKRFSDAFDAYREGLERLFVDDASADRLGQALQNAFQAGIEAKRFVEAGRLMTLLANRSGASPATINLGAMASGALLRADMPRDAVIAFASALSVFGDMESGEAAEWIETVTDMAKMFVGRLKTPEAVALAEALRCLESKAEVAGWGHALCERPAWAKLLSGLEVSWGHHHD